MRDLNDFAYFAAVVTHGGFAPAGRALREPKSKLSRRIAGLEARLGVRLIERSTRRFRVTETGQAFFERCRALLAEAEQAEALVAAAQAEPQGRVRVSCPTGLLEVLAPLLPGFLARHPKVQLQVLALDRAVDPVAERVDVALRVRTALVGEAALTLRILGRSTRILVASPALALRLGGRGVAALAELAMLSSSEEEGAVEWQLEGPAGAKHRLRAEPRFACSDFAALLEAVAAGSGVALLPDHVCRPLLEAGRIVRLLPEWRGIQGIVHAVFTTRRGLPPAVRAFIDHLAAQFPPDMEG